MMGLRLFASLSAYGAGFFGAYVTAMYDLARDFARRLRAAGDFEPAVEPESNIVCFRYLGRGRDGLDETLRGSGGASQRGASTSSRPTSAAGLVRTRDQPDGRRRLDD
jgi:glutamate/tyrosine decarboxylase-like PLP-dependent enzyme